MSDRRRWTSYPIRRSTPLLRTTHSSALIVSLLCFLSLRIARYSILILASGSLEDLHHSWPSFAPYYCLYAENAWYATESFAAQALRWAAATAMVGCCARRASLALYEQSKVIGCLDYHILDRFVSLMAHIEGMLNSPYLPIVDVSYVLEYMRWCLWYVMVHVNAVTGNCYRHILYTANYFYISVRVDELVALQTALSPFVHDSCLVAFWMVWMPWFFWLIHLKAKMLDRELTIVDSAGKKTSSSFEVKFM